MPERLFPSASLPIEGEAHETQKSPFWGRSEGGTCMESIDIAIESGVRKNPKFSELAAKLFCRARCSPSITAPVKKSTAAASPAVLEGSNIDIKLAGLLAKKKPKVLPANGPIGAGTKDPMSRNSTEIIGPAEVNMPGSSRSSAKVVEAGLGIGMACAFPRSITKHVDSYSCNFKIYAGLGLIDRPIE